jgi:flagellar protein FlaJ
MACSARNLKKISSEISWGVPLKKVVMDFVRRTKSWMTQIVMFLLVETVDVGGGTIEWWSLLPDSTT